MKVSRAEAAQNRERIIDTAAKLFRERGFDGIGVADLMKSAGMTHGGFYGHFASKEDLMAQACARALEGGLDAFQQMASHDRKSALAAIASSYLSPEHRDQPGAGCVLAALGADAARHGAPVRATFTQAIRSAVELLTDLVAGRARHVKRQRALAIYASMVGAVVLARAVDDEELSTEILKSVLESIVPTDA